MNSNLSSFTEGFNPSDFDENIPFKVEEHNREYLTETEREFEHSQQSVLLKNNESKDVETVIQEDCFIIPEMSPTKGPNSYAYWKDKNGQHTFGYKLKQNIEYNDDADLSNFNHIDESKIIAISQRPSQTTFHHQNHSKDTFRSGSVMTFALENASQTLNNLKKSNKAAKPRVNKPVAQTAGRKVRQLKEYSSKLGKFLKIVSP